MSFGGLFNCYSKSSYAEKRPRMTAVIHKISVGAGEKHTLSPEKSLRRSVKTTLTIDHARIRVPLRRRRRIQQCLILKRNCCNRIVTTQRQRLQNGLESNSSAVTFWSWDMVWRMWAWPRILSARIALYYGRTISNLLPTGLLQSYSKVNERPTSRFSVQRGFQKYIFCRGM